MTPTPTPAGAIALEQATRVRRLEEFAGSIIEAPNCSESSTVAPGMVTIGMAVTVRAGDQDAYLRAVRAAVKTAFDAGSSRG